MRGQPHPPAGPGAAQQLRYHCRLHTPTHHTPHTTHHRRPAAPGRRRHCLRALPPPGLPPPAFQGLPGRAGRPGRGGGLALRAGGRGAARHADALARRVAGGVARGVCRWAGGRGAWLWVRWALVAALWAWSCAAGAAEGAAGWLLLLLPQAARCTRRRSATSPSPACGARARRRPGAPAVAPSQVGRPAGSLGRLLPSHLPSPCLRLACAAGAHRARSASQGPC
jgi:hypothetical protein